MFLKDRENIPYDVEITYLQGEDCMQREEYSLASSFFADALIEEPHCLDYHLNFAAANLRRGGLVNLVNADKVLKRICVDSTPLSEKYLHGRVLEKLGRYDEAKDAYFNALMSSYKEEEAPELALVHYYLSALSERYRLKMKRPKGFRAPDTDIWLETRIGDADVLFQLRVFKKKKQEVRLISITDPDLVDIYQSARKCFVEEVRSFFDESRLSFASDSIVWILHYPFDKYVTHLTEKIIFDEKMNISCKQVYTSEFENVSGYRLLWSHAHHR